jgi:quercetin dioxygenase-like cupin family protein
MSARPCVVLVVAVLIVGCGDRRGAGDEGGAESRGAQVASGGDDAAPPAAGRFAIAAADVEARVVAGGEARARVVVSPAATGNDDASITLIELDEEVEAMLPSVADSATLAFVIEGRGTFRDAAGEAIGGAFVAGDAAFSPAGVPLGVRAIEPSVVLIAYAPGGPEARFAATREEGDDLGEGEIIVLPGQAAEAYELAAGLGEVRIYADRASVGSASASLGLLEAGPGMEVPAHTHDDASEYLYLLSGRGTMRAADQTFEVREGMGVQVPRGVEHAFVVEGQAPVRAVQIYAPAGPEQRFKRQ